jgi:hypothetical protein
VELRSLLPAAILGFMLHGTTIVPALAQGVTPDAEARTRKLTPIPACVDFSNLGTNNPKLLNSCDDDHTIGVSNYRAGVHILDRVFHLNRKEERPIAFPGDLMGIDWVKDWTNDGAEVGDAFLHLYHRDLGGTDLWEVRNNHPSRVVAFNYIIYENGKKNQSTWHALGSGKIDRLHGFTPPDKGFLVLDWARLDPD